MYEYSVEAEMARLKEISQEISELKNETVKAIAMVEKSEQKYLREIARLRGMEREFLKSKGMLEKMTFVKLFDFWADFDDEESQEAVMEVIDEHGLGNIDAVSFMAYCAGFQKAASFFKE